MGPTFHRAECQSTFRLHLLKPAPQKVCVINSYYIIFWRVSLSEGNNHVCGTISSEDQMLQVYIGYVLWYKDP